MNISEGGQPVLYNTCMILVHVSLFVETGANGPRTSSTGDWTDALCHLPIMSQTILLSWKGRMGAIPCHLCQLPQGWPRYVGNTDGPPFTQLIDADIVIIGASAIAQGSGALAGIPLSVSCRPGKMELRGQTR
jgi:hypothetical protein